MDSCLFCKIIKEEIPAKIVYSDDDLIAFEDISPQAPVHILIIPRKHIEKIADLTEEDSHFVAKSTLVAKKLAAEHGIDESGFRLVYNNGRDGGQHVYHIHMHLLGGRSMQWPPG